MVGNTNRDVLDALAEVTCVGYVAQHSKATEKHKSSYLWSVQSVIDVYYLLTSIEPYLYIKRLQAKLVIDFCKAKVLKGWFDEEVECYNKLKKLNMRGVKNVTED